LALDCETGVEGLLERRLDRFDNLERGEEAAALLRRLGAGRLQRCAAGVAVGQRRRGVTRAAHRGSFQQQFLGVGQAFGQRVIAAAQAVNQPKRERLLGPDMAAAEHQLQRGLHANQPRRALRAAGSGEEPELHFR